MSATCHKPAHPPGQSAAPWDVTVLAFDGISPFHLSVPCLVFGEDRRTQGMPPVRCRVAARVPGVVPTSAGFTLNVTHGLEALDATDMVIVPSWTDLAATPPGDLLTALRQAHARGTQLVGLCLGAFALGHAGLLNGRRATTHWHWIGQFARQFPGVQVDADALYVDTGDRVMTSAGTAAALDCCLQLVTERCGAAVANRVARRLVVAPHRAGGQAQFVEQPVAETSGDLRITELLAWLNQHLEQPHTVAAAAARAAMSPRSFTRHFRQATGVTLIQWVNQQRLERARQLLETTALDVESVAARVGFGSALALRQRFTQVLGTSPTRYRAQFRHGAG